MKTVAEVSGRLGPAGMAWLMIWRPKYDLTTEAISKKLREKIGEEVEPASIEEYLTTKGAPYVSESGQPEADTPAPGTIAGQFSAAMERDIELALLSQLDSLGLQMFVDENGRHGQQYPVGEFGRIDLLTVNGNGDFVVIELKRYDAPRATIGQIAGYIAFVKKKLSTSEDRSVIGWILARPSSLQEDRILEDSANAVDISVKWYSVRLELLEGSPFSHASIRHSLGLGSCDDNKSAPSKTSNLPLQRPVFAVLWPLESKKICEGTARVQRNPA
jgi:hypothetical protein